MHHLLEPGRSSLVRAAPNVLETSFRLSTHANAPETDLELLHRFFSTGLLSKQRGLLNCAQAKKISFSITSIILGAENVEHMHNVPPI